MAAKEIMNFKGGINLRLPAWHPDMETRKQCVMMQNLTYADDFIDSIPGTKKFHGTSLGTDPITALLPYYNDQTDDFKLLVASGGSIYKRNTATNEMETLESGLTPNSVFSSATRYDVQYIASVKDGLKKYLGGNQIETVGGGSTAPGSFRVILYMKEIDRLFGVSDDAIYGQITWCDLGEPEVWDGAIVERFKLKEGERVEGAAVLYGKLIVYCTYTTWIYYVSGNEENWKLEEAPTSVGCVAPNTIKKDGQRILSLGESPNNRLGVYSFNGTSSTLLTDDVDPLFKNVNRNKLRNACAEIVGDVYRISFATGFSQVNNMSIDLDLINTKEDGTPAIYGPHTIAFYSSCVLNGRQNNKEFLMGDESDGFVYIQGGTSLKSVTGDDGQLLEQRFLSRIHRDEASIMKQYSLIGLFFQPRGSFNAKLNYYLSFGGFANKFDFRPSASVVGFAGDFNVYTKSLQGTPSLYEFQEFPGMTARGTALQLEIINDSRNGRIAFDGYKYDFSKLYETKRTQAYAT